MLPQATTILLAESSTDLAFVQKVRYISEASRDAGYLKSLNNGELASL